MLHIFIRNTFHRSATPVTTTVHDSVSCKSINMVGLACWTDAARHFYENTLKPTTINFFSFKLGFQNVTYVEMNYSRFLKRRQPFQNGGVIKQFLKPTFCLKLKH